MRIFTTLALSLFLSACIHVGGGELRLSQNVNVGARNYTARQSLDFWQAMQQLDFNFAETQVLTQEQRQFANGLEMAVGGNYLEAQDTLGQIFSSSSDSTMRKNAALILTGLYTLAFDWSALIGLDSQLPNGLDDMNTIAMIKAWSTCEPEAIHYPDQPMTLAMEKSMSGVPMIGVLVNGVKQTFWVDTGAEFTVLSSEIAEECGVMPLIEQSSKVGTATDKKINLLPGMIEELKIGQLVFENHPVFIIRKADLEFRIFKIFKLLKIDGILGWNAIQNLNLEIDYAQNALKIQKPGIKAYPIRNFHFLTQPFVTLSDTNGTPLRFFLDTGANKTSLYAPAFAIFDTSSARKSRAMVGGAGGMQKITQLELKDQSLILGDTRIDFALIDGKSALGDAEKGFIYYDGILGSDIAKDGILTLDFQNGWCELKPGSK